MARRSDSLVIVIGVFKLLKAVVLVLCGVAGLLVTPERLAWDADAVVDWIGIYPGRQTTQQAIEKVWSLDQSTAEWLGVLALAYAAVFLVEGLGLLARKRWAEWLTVVVTASFIPVEIYEVVHQPSVTKLLTLGVNVAIVIYLARRRLQERPGRIGRGWLGKVLKIQRAG